MNLPIATILLISAAFGGLSQATASEGYAAAPDARTLNACVVAIQAESTAATKPASQELIIRISRSGNRYEYWINTTHANSSGTATKTRSYCYVRSDGKIIGLHVSAGLWDKPVRRPLLASESAKR